MQTITQSYHRLKLHRDIVHYMCVCVCLFTCLFWNMHHMHCLRYRDIVICMLHSTATTSIYGFVPDAFSPPSYAYTAWKCVFMFLTSADRTLYDYYNNNIKYVE